MGSSNSARGLLRYYATKKEAPDNLDPNPALLARLQTENNVVCERTETVKPKPKPKGSNVVRNNKPDRPARAERPAAPQQASKPYAPRAPKTAQGGGAQGKLSGKKIKIGGLR